MSCLRAVVSLALLCVVASAIDQDPPQNEDYDHHEHYPVPFEDAKTSDLAQDLNDPNTLAEIEVRKFYRPPIFHPYYYPLLHRPHPSPETPEEVTNTEDSSSEDDESQILEDAQPYDSVTITDEIHFNEGEARMDTKSYEVPCDFLTVPRYSCYSCYTYLDCKQDGGKVKSCNKREAPFCNNGVCSPTPSAECSDNSTTLLNIDSDNDEIDQTEEQKAETTTDKIHFNEGEARMDTKSYEVPCDFLTMPRYSCYSCYTYLDCKQDGGKVKSCNKREAPFCNNGVCSPTPSAECSDNSTTLFNTDSDNDEIDQTEEQEAETITDEVHLNEVEPRMYRKSYEVPCDFLTMPRYSCYSCYTYLDCKQDGGKVKSCNEREAPFCNNGVCSPTPSAECSDNSTTLLNTDSDNDDIDQTEEQEAETITDEVPLNEVEPRMDRKSYEVPCDFLTVPRYSCYSCYTYLDCKQDGGKVKSCNEREAPFCNNGVCSPNPSAECSENSTILFN